MPLLTLEPETFSVTEDEINSFFPKGCWHRSDKGVAQLAKRIFEQFKDLDFSEVCKNCSREFCPARAY